MPKKRLDVLALPISDTVRRLNPNVFPLGGLGASQHRQPQGTLGPGQKAEPVRRRRVAPGADVTITLTALIGRRLDPDNLGHAFKPLQDSIAEWLGVDDGDPRIRWEYGQAETRSTAGVLVRITTTPF